MNSIWYQLFFEVKVAWKPETETVKNICFLKTTILDEFVFFGTIKSLFLSVILV